MKKRASVFAIWMVLFVMVAGTAVAVEGEVGDDEPTEFQQPVIEPTWDDEAGVVIVTIGDGDTEPCATVTYERNEETGELTIWVDGVSVAEGATLPDGCIVQDATGPNGQQNHGTMVSAIARNLSPHDLDVPKGWIMREVAKVKDGDIDDDEGDDAEGEKPEKPEKVKKEKKEKKEKPAKPDKSKGKKGNPPGKNK